MTTAPIDSRVFAEMACELLQQQRNAALDNVVGLGVQLMQTQKTTAEQAKEITELRKELEEFRLGAKAGPTGAADPDELESLS